MIQVDKQKITRKENKKQNPMLSRCTWSCVLGFVDGNVTIFSILHKGRETESQFDKVLEREL